MLIVFNFRMNGERTSAYNPIESFSVQNRINLDFYRTLKLFRGSIKKNLNRLEQKHIKKKQRKLLSIKRDTNFELVKNLNK